MLFKVILKLALMFNILVTKTILKILLALAFFRFVVERVLIEIVFIDVVFIDVVFIDVVFINVVFIDVVFIDIIFITSLGLI